MRRRTTTDLGFRAALWRALDVVRVAATLYAVVAFVTRPEPYERVWLGWVVLAGMFAWSVYVAVQPRRSRNLLILDLAVATAAVLSTAVVDTRELASATNTLPLIWPVAAVMSWAVWRGAWHGIAAAAAIGLADLLVVDPITRRNVHNLVLLGFAGGVVGFAAELYERTRRDIADALQAAAAAHERERLARDIHDSVLQVLAFAQRRGAELGGEAAELGRLAGEQERRLRTLISRGPVVPPPGDELDVLAALRELPGDRVQVCGPAGRVLLPVPTGTAVVEAVRACLQNVALHAGPGAQTFVLVEAEPGSVVVGVRDDGVGFEAARPAQAQAEGRLGLSKSIRGRISEIGGRVEIWSAPGQGVEIELWVPRPVTTATERSN